MLPVIFSIGPLTLHSYGFMMALGAVVGIWRATRVSSRYGIEESRIVDAGIIALFFGLIGGRLTYVILNWEMYSTNLLETIAVWDGGLTFYGGLILGAVALIVWARIVGISVADLADVCAPSLALSYAFARIGCFLNGCCYGSETVLPWAVRFYADGGAILTPPSHPAQIYSSILSVIVFWLLTRIEKKSPPSGALFGFWMILSSVERFIMEVFRRSATAQDVVPGLTQAQAASLLILVVGGIIIFLASRNEGSNAT